MKLCFVWTVKTPQIYGSKPDYSKQAEFSIATLFFLSVKHNYDSQQLKQILETNGVSSLTIQEICKQYEFNKTDLANHCVKYGFSLPHITEVDWKLTCDIKSSSIENSDNELNFNINFGRLNDGTGERETIVEFICNPEELQSLINKFKDIERHCEKISLNK